MESENRISEIHYPFLRGHKYSFGELRTFEATLLQARQLDAAFSGDVRSNRVIWAKTRNEELLPIALLADSKGFPDSDKFELMPEGHSTDVQVYRGEQTIRYQITVADPSWADTSPRGRGGHLRHLRMERLRLGKPAFGGANMRKEKGVIVSEPHARDVRDDVDACRRALVEAIKRKQVHDGAHCTLLIYAREYRFLLIDLNVAELVTDAVLQAGATSFERVCVVDERFFWESV